MPRRFSSTESRVSDPLRILFCGSDSFSCASLLALNKLRMEEPDLVKSIDVVVRKPKYSGRGMKILREVEAQVLATELGLPFSELRTFHDWDAPKPDGEDINLIVAVSFGLFIPAMLIEQAKYGGLNVHPSLLPDLRGAAPLHHTILHGLSHTGVTLQTLSTEGFDLGTRLLQIPPSPGLPVPERATVGSLLKTITPLGAEALVAGIRQGLHVPPYSDAGWWSRAHVPQISKRDKKLEAYHRVLEANITSLVGKLDLVRNLRIAPKMTKDDQRIVWTKSWTAEQLNRQWRANGSLWAKLPATADPEAPFVHPYVKRSALVEFTAIATRAILCSETVKRLSRDRDWIESAVIAGRNEAKVAMKSWRRNRIKQREALTDEPETTESITIDHLRQTIEYLTPGKGKSLDKLFSNPDALRPAKGAETMHDHDPIVAFYQNALVSLHYHSKTMQHRQATLRLIFSEPEPLSVEDSLAARKRFNGTDVGMQGCDLTIHEDSPKIAKEKQKAKGPDNVGPRSDVHWVQWIDPVQKGKNQRDLGGPRNKESKIERTRRKEKKIEQWTDMDDKTVQAQSFGQVWLEPADEQDQGPYREGVPQWKGSILIPDTSSTMGVFRVHQIKAEGESWKSASDVIMPYLEAITTEKYYSLEASRVGYMHRYNDIMLGTSRAPRTQSYETEKVPTTTEERVQMLTKRPPMKTMVKSIRLRKRKGNFQRNLRSEVWTEEVEL